MAEEWKLKECEDALISARKKLISSLGTDGMLILEHEVLAIIHLIEAHFHMNTDIELD